MYFDGSDVGIGRTDVDAFHINTDGSILMSFVHPINFKNALGKVDDSDIVKFIPTQLGGDTSGAFELYFDGSDVGLNTGSEDIDAFSFTTDGKLVISTYGSVNVPGLSAKDEDILIFTATGLGDNTQGSWALYFDGSDVELTQGSEDIDSVAIDPLTGEIYLVTRGEFNVNSVNALSGDSDDLFRCVAQSVGDTTTCTFSLAIDGDDIGFRGRLDSAFLTWGPVAASDMTTVQSAGLLNDDLPQLEVDADDLDFSDTEIDLFDDAQESENNQVLLPLIYITVPNRAGIFVEPIISANE